MLSRARGNCSTLQLCPALRSLAMPLHFLAGRSDAPICFIEGFIGQAMFKTPYIKFGNQRAWKAGKATLDMRTLLQAFDLQCSCQTVHLT